MIERYIVIGDIHGCSRSLEQLLAKVKPDTGRDSLIFLGDLFDRGPDSHGVYRMVQELEESFSDDFVLLRGNHEDYLLQPKLTTQQRMIWDRVGRQATIKSFRDAGEHMEDAIPWLREHACLFWRTDLFQCVHAGAMIEPLEANDLQTLIHDHEIARQNRYCGKLTVTGHIALKKATWFTGDGETIVEIDEEKIYDLPGKGTICIDTGCGKGGRLTAMMVEGHRFSLISAEGC